MQDVAQFEPQNLRFGPHENLIHQSETWGQIRVDLVKRTALGRQETRIAHSGHTFLLNLAGTAHEGEDFVDGRRVPFEPRQPGSIIYIPAQSEWRGWDAGDEVASYLLLSIAGDLADRLVGLEVSGRLSELSPSIGFRDPVVEAALQNIVQELKSPDTISSKVVETQAATIFVRLLRMRGALGKGYARGGLSPFDLKRAIAILVSLSGERPSLVDLAEEFDLTPRHFCRAFKQSMGETPHAYMARHRLERSADMLRNTNASATEIALECGFGSSSNFTIAFKRGFGQSPTQFRRSTKV